MITVPMQQLNRAYIYAREARVHILDEGTEKLETDVRRRELHDTEMSQEIPCCDARSEPGNGPWLYRGLTVLGLFITAVLMFRAQ